jgi:hypothetical protein
MRNVKGNLKYVVTLTSLAVATACGGGGEGVGVSGKAAPASTTTQTTPADLTQPVHGFVFASEQDFFMFRATAANGATVTGDIAPPENDRVELQRLLDSSGSVEVSIMPPDTWLQPTGEPASPGLAADVVSGNVTLARTFCATRALVATNVRVAVANRSILAGVGLYAPQGDPNTPSTIRIEATGESNTKYCPWSTSNCTSTHGICYGPFSLGCCYPDKLGVTCWCSACGY